MWWQDLLWGFWNGLTAWIVLIAHVFGFWTEFPFYNSARGGTGMTSVSSRQIACAGGGLGAGGRSRRR